MPLPFPTPNTDLGTIRRLLDQAAALLKKSGRSVSETQVSISNRAHGKSLSIFAQTAARAVEECADAYKGLPATVSVLREKDGRVQALSELRDVVSALYEQVNQDWLTARVDLSEDVTSVFTATDGIQAHPGVDATTKAKVASATVRLFALREERRKETSAAAATTRASNDRHLDDGIRIAALTDELTNARRLLDKQPGGREGAPEVTPGTPVASFAIGRPAALARARRRPRAR